MQHDEHERDGWVRLEVPVPPRLAELIGYRGKARWVAFYWTACGDESFYNDGQVSGTGHSWPYLEFLRHPAVAPSLTPFNLGSSDFEATECLILDRDERVLHVAAVRSARGFLHRQHPPLPELPPGALQRAETSLADLLDLRTWQEVKIDQAAVERAMSEERREIAEMVAFLNQHVK
jgi:hypothetical protein